MNPPATCAAAGCDNPVPDRAGQPGRPNLYCSPTCRPSTGRRRRAPLSIDVHQDDDDTGNPRTWTVQLRRGVDTITIGRDLGRFTAAALARDLQQLIHPARQEGDPID